MMGCCLRPEVESLVLEGAQQEGANDQCNTLAEHSFERFI